MKHENHGIGIGIGYIWLHKRFYTFIIATGSTFRVEYHGGAIRLHQWVCREKRQPVVGYRTQFIHRKKRPDVYLGGAVAG